MKIAITGGIGSGKSVICQRLAKRGIQVYDCDSAAKRLMRTDTLLQKQLCELVGDDCYKDGVLQKKILAQFLLESEANKQAINEIVHPAVARDFENSGYDWIESAILFESQFQKRTHIDKVVCVVAPIDLRIKRIMVRDNISREKAQAWINTQIPQEEVKQRSNYVLVSGQEDIEQQIDAMLDKMKADGVCYSKGPEQQIE